MVHSQFTPHLTIVTPSFNQAQFLEQTIDSVLSQNYPYLHYLIIDGGSTDGSVDIIRRHAHHLAFWVSEKDRGQSQAINKGFAHAARLHPDQKNHIHAYINSDDYYAPGAFAVAADVLADKSRAWLCGDLRIFDSRGNHRFNPYPGDPPPGAPEDDAFLWFFRYRINQPSTFWTADLTATFGPFNENLRYVFDWEFFTRIRFHGRIPAIPVQKLLAHFRLHDASKSISEGERFDAETDTIWPEILRPLPPRERRLASDRRRFAIADDLQIQSLQYAKTGDHRAAFRALAHSIKHYPSLLFRRRTLGCLRRAAAIF